MGSEQGTAEMGGGGRGVSHCRCFDIPSNGVVAVVWRWCVEVPTETDGGQGATTVVGSPYY